VPGPMTARIAVIRSPSASSRPTTLIAPWMSKKKPSSGASSTAAARPSTISAFQPSYTSRSSCPPGRARVEHADVLGRLPQLPAGLRTVGEEREAVQDLRGAAAHLEVRRRGAVGGERRGLDGDAGEGDPGQGGHVRAPP